MERWRAEGQTLEELAVITKSEVMPLLVTACPSYADRFQRYVAENYNNTDERLVYLELGDFAKHLCELLESGNTSELPGVFAAIEVLHNDGDDSVREAATVGLLEDLQNFANQSESIAVEDFEPLLGAESLRWWTEVREFWRGNRTYVGEGLEAPEEDETAP